ncbi:MAG TPA: acyclic terpene utilization AtuA family protein [Solirubrobacterales bacterium]|nr:acyclic terpene utilization AtuA family protein [Solirubrobacterales bacterium]
MVTWEEPPAGVVESEALRVGCGAAGEPDRPELAAQMVRDGNVSYVCFDTLAERTLAGAQLRKAADPSAGYDVHLRARLGGLIGPALERGVRLMGNMGAANPEAAVEALTQEAGLAGVEEFTVATVTGDDLLERVRAGDVELDLWSPEDRIEEMLPRLVSANAYLGFEPILAALDGGADVVVTGRGADVAPYLAAIFHGHGWDLDDLQLRARAAVIGHMLECGRCVTGTCFAEPAYGRFTPDPANVSMPLAEVAADGSAVITKVPGTGGLITRPSCAEQLIHETGDPRAYLTPDVTLDISQVALEEVGTDRVRISGARGGPAPATLKVLLGVDEGVIAEGEVSFGGPGCVEKARQCAAIFGERIAAAGGPEELRSDLIGVDSVLGAASPDRPEPAEVRLRVAARYDAPEQAETFVMECQDFWWAPGLGAGGVTTSVRRVLGMHSASVVREAVEPAVSVRRRRPREEALDAAR